MKAIICDRCKKVCNEMDAAALLAQSGFGAHYRIDLCEECKRWLLNEFNIKEEWEEKV